jgi:hypothetical protein
VSLRALEAARQSLRVRLWAAPVIVGSGLVGMHAGGAYGAGVGLAASSAFSAALTWSALRRALAREAAGRDRPVVEDPLAESIEIPTLNG